jgi:hypothetical protein
MKRAAVLAAVRSAAMPLDSRAIAALLGFRVEETSAFLQQLWRKALIGRRPHNGRLDKLGRRIRAFAYYPLPVSEMPAKPSGPRYSSALARVW